MHFHLVTLFPDMFESFVRVGILGRAIEQQQIEFSCINPREFTTDRHRTVDDTPYGGGSGMVMMPGPLLLAMEDIEAREERPVRRILLTPQGKPLQQADSHRWAQESALTLVCGRYEGVDERVRQEMHEEVSLGDFVLFGGEVAAMALVESVTRLLPGVLGNVESAVEESHSQGRLEYPHYTRPAEFRGQSVPPVLLSGNHGAIAEWRRRQSLLRTARRRPDLLSGLVLDEAESAWLAEAMRGEDA